jgi:hypothetical protein
MNLQWIAEIPPALMTASAAFVCGILGTLLTIFVTPCLQHYFWKRQKREEIRFTIVNEVNRLAAQFMMRCYARDMPESIPALELTFYESWLGRVCKVYRTPSHKMVAAISHMAL